MGIVINGAVCDPLLRGEVEENAVDGQVGDSVEEMGVCILLEDMDAFGLEEDAACAELGAVLGLGGGVVFLETNGGVAA